MLKWLLLVALAFVAYRWLVRLPSSRTPQESRAAGEAMVECVHCGIHFPQSEAVFKDGQYFCGEQHYALWQQLR